MKIACCIPVHSDTKAVFTKSLGELLIHTTRERPGIDIELLFTRRSLISYARNELALKALQAKADYALWLDADHDFPKDAALRLLNHGLPFVGANYLLRDAQPRAAAVALDGRRLSSAGRNGIEEVQSLGFGLCLLDVSVIARMDDWPLFHVEIENGQTVGEDVYFCRKLRAAGVPIHIDHNLSNEVGHIAETVLKF